MKAEVKQGQVVVKAENMREVVELVRHGGSFLKVEGQQVSLVVPLNGSTPAEPEQAKAKPKKQSLGDFARKVQASQKKRTSVISPEEEQRRVDAYNKYPGDQEAAKAVGMDPKSFGNWRIKRGLISKRTRGGHPNPAYKG